MRHVVVAPDKFKGTLTAARVAAHVAAGLGRASPGLQTVQVPVADGGDGTVDAAEAAGYRRVEMGVRGPTGAPLTASFALLDGTAVIESAQACGLTRLPGGVPAPLTATSRGVGELILAVVRMRAKRVVLGLGGVACTDGGAGLVTALGGRLVDSSGAELPPGGAALSRLDHIDATRLRDLSGIEVVAAIDVDNPLLGPRGAAAVYGPQKGASPDDVAILEEGLARWADVTEQSFGFVKRDEPGAGAAGGLGFAALGFLGASTRPGIELMLELLSFTDHLPGARLVITGEGALDAQTLHGKAPAGVARAAAAVAPDVPVVAVAGVCSLTPGELRSAGIAQAYALADIEPDFTRCCEQPGPLLEEVAGHIARDWLASLPTAMALSGRNAPAAAGQVTAGPPERRRIRPAALVAAAYFGLSVIPYWGFWTAGGTRIAGKGGDLPTGAWFLEWVCYALVHRHNPLLTDWGNYPYGVNGATNLSMPLLGVLGAPVTLALGAFVTTTAWFTLAFPLSALAGYALLRRWVRWRPAAFGGGLLYGFSPYLAAHGGSHLNLVFVPLPPLIFLVLDQVTSGRARRAWPWGLALGGLCAAQFLISAEILASTVIIGAIGLAIAAGVRRDAARERWRFTARAAGIASAVTAVLLAYPLWLLTAGPARVSGPVQDTALYRGNLLAPLIPDSSMRFRVAGWLPLADTFSGTTSENGLYIGLPLLTLLVAGAIALRRRPVMRVAALTTAAAFVISLGSRLTAGHWVWTAVPLPEAALTHVPVLDNTIAARYSLYVMLGAAVIFALTVEAMRECLRQHRRWPGRAPATACAALAGLALLPLVPAWPYWTQTAQVPRYYSSSLVTAIPPGRVAVLYPFPSSGDAIPMLAQVAAGMRFKSPGGRFVIPAPGSTGTPASSRPTLTGQVLTGLAGGHVPALTPGLRRALLDQLRSWHVRAVLVQVTGARPGLVLPFFGWLLGRPPDARAGGISAWYE